MSTLRECLKNAAHEFDLEVMRLVRQHAESNFRGNSFRVGDVTHERVQIIATGKRDPNLRVFGYIRRQEV